MTERGRKIRVLLAKSAIDAHDRGVKVIARELRDSGMEVIMIRYWLPEEVVEAAVHEGVDLIGLSFSSGAHSVDTKDVVNLLKGREMDKTRVIVGGVISAHDIPGLLEMGVGQVFGAGSDPAEVRVRTKISWQF